jgi:hypothetical protein
MHGSISATLRIKMKTERQRHGSVDIVLGQ